jgi:hypothetical protein
MNLCGVRFIFLPDVRVGGGFSGGAVAVPKEKFGAMAATFIATDTGVSGTIMPIGQIDRR